MRNIVVFVITAVVSVLTICVPIAATTIINGWVLSILWGWFMVPILSLPQLSVPAAMGIALVVGNLTHQYNPRNKHDEDNDEDTVRLFFALIVFRPLFVLSLGWIVKAFL